MKKFKLVLKSLINNDACIEGGRKNPWWIGVLMFFVAMVLALVPIFSQTISKKGSEFITSNSDGFEVGAQRFIEDINDRGLILEIKEDGKDKYLSLDQKTWDEAYTYTDSRYYHAYNHLNENGKTDLEVFYIENITKNDVNYILNDVSMEEGVFLPRTTSVLILSQKEYYAARYVLDSTSTRATTSGDYKHFETGYRLNYLNIVHIDGVAYDHHSISEDKYNVYQAGIWDNWVFFFNQGYLYTRGQLTWKTTLIMFGINVGITIFMGLMIFILTRGKYNPFKIYTIFDCMLIACWASLAPAILAVPFGFLIKSFSQVIYPLLLGVRVMWLSMKSLRPDYTNQGQQQNSKQVKTVDVKPAKNKNK